MKIHDIESTKMNYVMYYYDVTTISAWRTAAIFKIIFDDNSAADCLTSAKFCTVKRKVWR